MKATHWSAFRNAEEWKDNPHAAAEEAAEEFFLSEEGWDSRDELEKSRSCVVTVHGFVETSEPLAEAEIFDGYEEGQSYFRLTGEALRVEISRTTRVIE